MPKCPQCSKSLATLPRKCPTCQADLELLVDFAGNLQGGLERAEELTRSGELGKAVWAYLEVLEVDPENPEARRQVSHVVTAVRQFDRTSPRRRWFRVEGWRRMLDFADKPFLIALWGVAVIGLLIAAFVLGYSLGVSGEGAAGPLPETPLERKEKTLGG